MRRLWYAHVPSPSARGSRTLTCTFSLPSRQPPTEEPAIVAAPDAPGPLRGGRGGAGNFVDPGELPGTDEAAREVGAAVLAASRSRNHQGRGGRGMGGRGGAGNWAGRPAIHNGSINAGDNADDDGHNLVDDEWDEMHGPHAQKVEALERRVKEVVDKGLRVPDKVHHGTDKSGYE